MSTFHTLCSVPEVSTIRDMLFNSAKTYPDNSALQDLTLTPIPSLTYRQLLETVLRFGSSLVTAGLQQRAHIAVIGENRAQWGIAYLACMVYNYVVVPIDKNLTPNEVLNILHESDAEAVVFSEQFENLILDSAHALKKLRVRVSMDRREHNEQVLSMPVLVAAGKVTPASSLPDLNKDDVAEIIFTSGSLGRAKGVMLSQQNLAANLVSMRQALLITPEDRFLSVLPIHHTYECTCGFLCPLYSGAAVYYARSLKTVTEDLKTSKATILLGVPLLYEKMFRRIYKGINEDAVKKKIIKPLISITNLAQSIGFKGAKQKVFSELHEKFGGHIRIFIAGGAAPDPLVARGLREFGFNFIQGYGLTETSPILTLNVPAQFKDNAAGIPLPNVQVKIHQPDSDGVGEVYARGANVMLGYYKNQKLTDDVFDAGWFKTGDLGFFDEDGFLHISGRKKNVIIANNGKNVFPEEIEDLLNRSPFVMESLVYGEQDDKHDEIIAAQIVADAEAFIELSERQQVPITEELIRGKIAELVKEINRELPTYKQVRKFSVRQKEFEKTTTQKIKRYLVAENGNVNSSTPIN